MRIITGSRRGVRLESLEGDNTRPTSERVKEAIFSAIQFELADRRVLDLFAGSGQMGLEALSRGAEAAVFVDASEDAVRIIRSNIEKCGFSDITRHKISDYRTYLSKADDSFDLVFIDPPYAMNASEDSLRRLVKSELLNDGALVVLESGQPLDTGALPCGFTVKKEARYSISYVTILVYHKEEAAV